VSSRSEAPEGWAEVFSGPCYQASVIQAVLETSGLRPVTQQYSAGWLAGDLLDDCRVYVPLDQERAALETLEVSAEPSDDA
jgi:hypothetical protein